MPRDRLLAELEADELPLEAVDLLLLERFLPGERGALLHLHDPAESCFERRGGVVDVVAVKRVGHFEAERIARAEAARGAAGAEQGVPEGGGVAGAAVELESILTGVAGAGDEALDPGDLAGGERVVGDRFELDGGEGLELRLALRALDREEAGLVRGILHPDVGAPLLRDAVGPILGDVRGVDDDHHPVFHPVDRAVVDDRPPFIQEGGVLHLPRLEGADVVGQQSLGQRVPVGAADLELSHMGTVEHPPILAHRLVLGQDPGRVLHRHLPPAEGDHLAARLHVVVEQRRTLQCFRHGLTSIWVSGEQ